MHACMQRSLCHCTHPKHAILPYQIPIFFIHPRVCLSRVRSKKKNIARDFGLLGKEETTTPGESNTILLFNYRYGY